MQAAAAPVLKQITRTPGRPAQNPSSRRHGATHLVPGSLVWLERVNRVQTSGRIDGMGLCLGGLEIYLYTCLARETRPSEWHHYDEVDLRVCENLYCPSQCATITTGEGVGDISPPLRLSSPTAAVCFKFGPPRWAAFTRKYTTESDRNV
ncbi:hypothetical protein BaRGS_00016735 [Batillaria attramentaria]|uniref:Uncharacterized protein n=1 Tax=Batillaria attramentaria TaxID=370345 RepID=A0ABD0KXS0_9CAEN